MSMNPRLADCLRLLRNRALWGNFPRDMRPWFLAQRGKCPYCGTMMITVAVGQRLFMKKKADRRREAPKHASWDHVFPRSLWGNSRGSKVVCHSSCNTAKGNRHPYPCEVFFRDVTFGIVAEIEDAMEARRA